MHMPLQMNNHVFASFPKTKLSAGLKLMHSPHMWSKGASLAIGVKPFEIKNVSCISIYNKERMMQFSTTDTDVTIISREPYVMHIYCSNGIRLYCKISEHTGSDTGFSLFLQLKDPSNTESENTWDHKWHEAYRRWIELTLFNLIDTNAPDVLQSTFTSLQVWSEQMLSLVDTCN